MREETEGMQSLVLCRTFPAFETLIEPHRLNSCLQCVAAVCCSLVNSIDTYPAGRTHVIYLLNLCLPGIDSNDIDKCLVSFHIRCLTLEHVQVFNNYHMVV
jgi:proteasome activator subunit 4